MILVTGGAGFIGSNLVAEIVRRRLGSVAVCDRFGQQAKWKNLAKHPVAAIISPENLMDWLEDNGHYVNCIFHMGAISATTETDVDAILDVNFNLSMKLWFWCAENDVRLIYASSAATYGDGTQGFLDDNMLSALSALRPLNPYGWSKQLFDINAVRLSEQGATPLQWAGLKFFNVYGPNEYHKGAMRSVAHQVFEQIRDTGKVTLFRSHHPDYEDGGQMRDFVWVGDCVDQMLWLYETPHVSGIYNCGSGKARSFLDLARAAFSALERPEKIDWRDTPQEIRRHYQYFTEADMTRLRQTGYTPQATDLETGINLYISDHLSQNDPYR
jgi:ADP-L-glycero-D-manno-heptose 6-epimerase